MEHISCCRLSIRHVWIHQLILKLKQKNNQSEKWELEGPLHSDCPALSVKIPAYSRDFLMPVLGVEPDPLSILHHLASLLIRQIARPHPWNFGVSQLGLGTTGFKAVSQMWHSRSLWCQAYLCPLLLRMVRVRMDMTLNSFCTGLAAVL
jgi:hypothetical protein